MNKTKKLPKIAEHYHVEICTENNEFLEICVAKIGNAYRIIDEWGDVSGKYESVLDSANDAKEAVLKAIRILKSKYKGYIVKGAGCPPSEWIDEEERNGNRTERSNMRKS